MRALLDLVKTNHYTLKPTSDKAALLAETKVINFS